MLCFTLRGCSFPGSFYFVKAKSPLLLSRQLCILTNTELAVPATISPCIAPCGDGEDQLTPTGLCTLTHLLSFLACLSFLLLLWLWPITGSAQVPFVPWNLSEGFWFLDLLCLRCWLMLTHDLALGYRLYFVSVSHLTYVSLSLTRYLIPHEGLFIGASMMLAMWYCNVLHPHVWVWSAWETKGSASLLRERRPLKKYLKILYNYVIIRDIL